MPPWPFNDPVSTAAALLLVVGVIDWIKQKLSRGEK